MFEATTYKSEADASAIPEIVRVDYDLWTLRLTCLFSGRRDPSYVEWQRVAGFRVLDEGQLCAFWQEQSRPKGWLWEFRSGGWFSHESKRDDFLLSHIQGVKEFFVLGINDCVSVLSWQEPRLLVAEP